MADTPTPRSLQQILGDMQDSFISRTGISSLKVGNPILSILESVAQSQLRDSQDVFTLLASVSLDRATGTALDAIAAEEGLVRKGASASTGSVTVTDTSVTKVSTYLQAEVAVNSTTINVYTANGISVGDNVYISYGKDWQELIEVTDISTGGNGTHFVLTLSTPTTKTHFAGEVVLLSQGGDRLVSAGVSLGTSPKFTVNQTYTIPDGFDKVENVLVVCSEVGVKGNVGYDTIKVINTKLTFNASVTNPLPFSNGFDEETDDKLRLRVRLARSNKQKATAAAVVNSVIGATSTDDNKTIASASLINDSQTGKATIYVDDGNGYEATFDGVSYEVLESYANGGEQFFALQGGRPIAPPFVVCSNVAPFDVTGTWQFGNSGNFVSVGKRVPLVVFVGGTQQIVSFPDNFPSSATTYDIVSHINSQKQADKTPLLFRAYSYNNRSQIMLVPRDGKSTIVVLAQPIQKGGASSFKFPANQANLIYISKNGNLLNENEYYIDRSRGTIALTAPLSKGDQLLVVAPDIRPALLSKNTVVASNQYGEYRHMWLSVDDKNSLIVKSLQKDDKVTITTNGNIKTIASNGNFSGVKAGDWLILADEAVVKNLIPWTEKILEAGDNYIKVCQQGTNAIDDASNVKLASDNCLVIARCSTPPQKVSLSTWNSFDSLVQSASSGLVGVTVSTVGNSDTSRLLTFKSAKYDIYASLKVLCITGSMSDLLGLSQGDLKQPVLGIYPKYSLDSVGDTDSPTFLYKKGLPATANFGEIFRSITTEENSAHSGYLYATDEGFAKTYSGGFADYWNQDLNDVNITNDVVTNYTGFQFGGSDSIDLLIDGERDDSYTMSLAMYKNAYLVSSGQQGYKLSSLSPEPPITKSLSSISLSDFALWTAPVSAALDSANETVTFTSKTVGKDSLYKRVELVYATAPNQLCSDSVLEGVVKVTIASGDSREPTGNNNVVYLRSSDQEDNVVFLEYTPQWYFHGQPDHQDETFFYCRATSTGGSSYYLDVSDYVHAGDTLMCSLGTATVTQAPYKYTYQGTDYWKIPVTNTITGSDVLYPVSIGSVATTLGSAINGDKVSFSIDGGKTTLVGRITNVPAGSFYAALSLESNRSPMTYDRFLSSPNIQVYPNNPSLFTDGNYSYVSPEESKSVYTDTLSTLEKHNFGNIDDVGVFSSGVNYIDYSSLSQDGDSFLIDVKSATPAPTIGDCKIVPVTSKNVSDFVNGAYGNRGFSTCVNSQRKVEFTRDEPGADRSIQITGGSANSFSFKASSIVDEKTLKTTMSSLSILVGSRVTVEQSLATKLLFDGVTGTIGTDKVVTLSDAPSDFENYFWNLWDWNNTTYTGSRSNRNQEKILAWNLPWKVIVDGDYVGFVLDKGTLLNQYQTTSDFEDLWKQVRIGSLVRIQPARFPLGTKTNSTFFIENYHRAFGLWKTGSGVKNYTREESTTITSIDEGEDTITFDGNVSNWLENDLIGPEDSMDSAIEGVYRILSVDETNYVFWVKNGSITKDKWTASTKASFATIFYATNSVLEGDSFQYKGSSTNLTTTVVSVLTDFASLASLRNNDSLPGRSDARSTISIAKAPSGQVDILNTNSLNFTKKSTVSVLDTVESIVPTGNKDEYTITLKNAGTQNQKDYPNVKGVYSLQRLLTSEQPSQSISISSKSKLGFSNSALFGNDAYNYYTGLIGEANKIVFGDAQDPVKYAGFASLNANVEILPPNIKQVKVGLFIRMLAGYSLRDVVQNVQSAVTSFVNATPIGQNIPYSGIIASASLVAGVQSVVVNDLTYGIPNSSTSTSDVISVMSDEKPLVLSLNDITVTQI